MMKPDCGKTLLVEFAPRDAKSRTKALRTELTGLIEQYTEITRIDLGKNTVPIMTNETVQAYYKRNYEYKELTKHEEQLLKPLDILRDQLMRTDVLILSTPMYNFGLPAPVKAWLDAVMQKGYAYTVNNDGHQPGLNHLKVCLIYTSGLVFDQINENESWNGLLAEAGELFHYMGADPVRKIAIEGADMLDEEEVEYRKQQAIKKLHYIAKEWYGVEKDLDCDYQ